MIKEFLMNGGYFAWGVVGLSLLALLFTLISFFAEKKSFLYVIIIISILSIIIGGIAYYSGVEATNGALLGSGIEGETRERLRGIGYETAFKPLKVSLYTSTPLILLSLVRVFIGKKKSNRSEEIL